MPVLEKDSNVDPALDNKGNAESHSHPESAGQIEASLMYNPTDTTVSKPVESPKPAQTVPRAGNTDDPKVMGFVVLIVIATVILLFIISWIKQTLNISTITYPGHSPLTHSRIHTAHH